MPVPHPLQPTVHGGCMVLTRFRALLAQTQPARRTIESRRQRRRVEPASPRYRIVMLVIREVACEEKSNARGGGGGGGGDAVVGGNSLQIGSKSVEQGRRLEVPYP